MKKMYKYRLCPNKAQVQKLQWTLDMCRLLYNSCLLDRKNAYEKERRSMTRIKQQQILRADKSCVESLAEIHSQVLQDVLFRVDRAFQNFFRRVKQGEKPGYPRFKGDGRYDSITYPQEPGFKITDKGLNLSKIGTIRIKLHRPVVGTIKTCTIRRQNGKWYACFSVEYEPVKKPVPTKFIGIDVGIKSFAVTSNGEVIQNPKYLINAEKKLAGKQRQLSRKKIGSKNRKKAKRIVANLHCKVRNKRADFQHKVSRKIVDNYGFIAVENLNIKGMVKNRYLAKYISDAGWGQFVHFLTYKAAEAGCKVEKVNPRHTSINCSTCGYLVPKTLTDRIHHCPFCDTTLDRDHNAAINILNRAGTARINAWGEAVHQCPSLNQEALSNL